MKSVLISTQPEWCALIVSGEKTREVRKTKPSGVMLGMLAEPFKCFIYCTSVKSLTLNKYVEVHRKTGGAVDDWSGKVFAEFLCDGIYPIVYTMDGLTDVIDCKTTCLNPKDFISYGEGKTLYGWSISELKVYDTPKELSEFWKADKCPYASIDGCTYKYHCFRAVQAKRCGKTLTSPPQSWCYVSMK